MKTLRCIAVAGLLTFPASAIGPSAALAEESTTEPDSGLVLKGGEDGTVLRTMTIQGEDRIRIEFDRPTLDLTLDPRAASGLEWGSVMDILDQGEPDMIGPLLRETARDRTPFRPRPWLMTFSSGPVARFRPDVEGVDGWRLTVANSRGETVRTFEGRGKPPKEIAWDGLAVDGTPARPGYVYSHTFEATDRAGNTRNFLGEGFQLPPYRVSASDQIAMLFSGSEIQAGGATRSDASTVAPAIVMEAATWLNKLARLDQPIRVEVTARSYEHADELATKLTDSLKTRLLGDPSRLHPITNVEPDAPSGGTVALLATRNELE